jgi:hypothetical protein
VQRSSWCLCRTGIMMLTLSLVQISSVSHFDFQLNLVDGEVAHRQALHEPCERVRNMDIPIEAKNMGDPGAFLDSSQSSSISISSPARVTSSPASVVNPFAAFSTKLLVSSD